MTRLAAVIQARMGSTRFPGKVLRPLAGKPLVEHIIKRLQSVNEIDLVALAIPHGDLENPLIKTAERLNIPYTQGPEEDVLARYIEAGNFFGAKNLIRICSDNPLLDLTLLRSLIERHLNKNADYTFSPDSIPLGTGSEIASLTALKAIAQRTEKQIYREHVTTYFHDYPQGFHLERVPAPAYLKNQNFRLTVDTEKDFNLLDILYKKYSDSSNAIVDLQTILSHLKTHPHLAQLNSDVPQKDWRK